MKSRPIIEWLLDQLDAIAKVASADEPDLYSRIITKPLLGVANPLLRRGLNDIARGGLPKVGTAYPSAEKLAAAFTMLGADHQASVDAHLTNGACLYLESLRIRNGVPGPDAKMGRTVFNVVIDTVQTAMQPKTAAISPMDLARDLVAKAPRSKAERVRATRIFVLEKNAELEKTEPSYQNRIGLLRLAVKEAGHGQSSVRTIKRDLQWVKDNPGRLVRMER